MELAQVAAQAATGGGIALLGTALTLGIRHGIDWDHIAAITDIASTTATTAASDAEGHPEDGPGGVPGSMAMVDGGGAAVGTLALAPRLIAVPRLALRPLGLASLYALGHAFVVVLLGLLALNFDAILPDWIDPLMERVVGVTLLVLGGWVAYSLVRFWRGAGDFRLRSRWMLVFAGVRRLRDAVETAIHGHTHLAYGSGAADGAMHVHTHNPDGTDQYGPRAAFAVGLVHGIGAETGTQVLIIAAVGGAATQGLGLWMLLAFVAGLLISNTALAVLASTGFVGSSRARTLYAAIGCVTALFSLVVGAYFALGAAGQLPNLEHVTAFLGGTTAG
jgi:high-affinity nickel-transport protein